MQLGIATSIIGCDDGSEKQHNASVARKEKTPGIWCTGQARAENVYESALTGCSYASRATRRTTLKELRKTYVFKQRHGYWESNARS